MFGNCLHRETLPHRAASLAALMFTRMDAHADFRGLSDALCRRLSDPDWESWTEAELERWAARAFAHQFGSCAPYRAFCERRGVTPDTVTSWTDVPAVPATAFKHFDFVSEGQPEPSGDPTPATTFRTSGTTRGRERRGRHHVPVLDLYRASLAEPFRRALLPEIAAGARREDDPSALFVSLVPSPDDVPDSSLSFMVGAAAERFAGRVFWLVDASGSWRTDELGGLREALEVAGNRDAPVLLLGTALSFVHLLEGGAAGRVEAATAVADALSGLPGTVRVMETGGFKGTRRTFSRAELYAGIESLTGISGDRIVNEYGMTELLSQLYEPVLDEGIAVRGLHAAPPWLRVRALHPSSLEPVPEGEEGILAFFDLANLGSVCHVLTEDVGSLEDGRVRLRGRAKGAEPRGCSRAMDDLMSATAESR